MLSHKDFIKQCYQNHIFVAPSQTDMKNGESEGGTPTVILEAMSTGMPVIGSNHADIPNIITDGRNGIIFEEGNEKQLYASIIRMIRLEKNWTEMGKHGRDFVYENHDLNKVSRQLENLYDLAIDINNNLNTR